MSKLLLTNNEKQMPFSFDEIPITVSDWSHVDCICIKSNSGILRQTIYLLDGHPLFDANITSEDKEYIELARKIGCYGNSEKAFQSNMFYDRFYIKTNINTREQQDIMIDYLVKKKTLSSEQHQTLKILENLESVLSVNDDYKPLYYCGFAKEIDSKEYSQIRFYFKMFVADEAVRFDGECIQYLEAFPIFQNDSMFHIVKELVCLKKAGLRCIGLEFGNNNSTKIKYYLCESFNGNSLKVLLTELPYFSELHKSGLSLLNEASLFQNLKYEWIQISKGNCDENGNISIYLDPVHRQKRKFYSLKEGLVLRNIGGIYFLIDIHEKRYYETKNLFMLNDTGKLIIEFLLTNNVCTIDGMVSYIKSQIINYSPELNSIIYNDCNEFVLTLLKNGFLREVM